MKKIIIVAVALIGVEVFLKVLGFDRVDIFKRHFYEKDGEIDGHEYVDLDLPNGKLWATCNVGATKRSELGNTFAWGEVKPKKTYTLSNYKWITHRNPNNHYTDQDSIIKYNCNELGIIDNKDTLEACDDAATVNWGGNWRMPTRTEWYELFDGCTWEVKYEHISKNNVYYKITYLVGTSVRNGHRIYFPLNNGKLHLWTSDLIINASWAAAFAGLNDEDDFYKDFNYTNHTHRYEGNYVRAVVWKE